ncbi:hypothetical protein AMTR_s00099p00072730 [Amborella trichopoda]|uniref:Pentacotripeptide-repeat region of PRORP domain-containing protein n=1 Tax=Amborella trichopoda TaxID=13333 RepID=W1NVS4_AMBTC|nr:hypothetical protein AMTR_s00099p00072730 [Amborella trichopoda]
MLRRLVVPNRFTFPLLLRSCGRLSNLSPIRQLHGHVLILGLSSDSYVANSLLHLYATRNEIENAQLVFNRDPNPDTVSYNTILFAYANFGMLVEACNFFDTIPTKDSITWSTMLTGYVKHEYFTQALNLFRDMARQSRALITEGMLVSVLTISAKLEALEFTHLAHEYINRQGFPLTPSLGTALLQAYATCGCVGPASEVFGAMQTRDPPAWNAMICACARHGLGACVLSLFKQFILHGLEPEGATLVGVLHACAHSGLVRLGMHYFRAMTVDYHLEPEMEHYGCIVDLLARAGLLEEAKMVIYKMPFEPDTAIWGSLLSACGTHGWTELGIKLGNFLIEIEPEHDGHYVMLAGLYAQCGRWEEASHVRRFMDECGTKKKTGVSLVHTNIKSLLL